MMGTLWNLQCRLLVAIQNNDVKHAQQLLEQGVDSDVRFQVGSQKRPAVCICAERGSVSMVKLLVRWGCSINQSDSAGLTPLHLAVSHGHEELVNLLLKNRANVKAITTLGYTALHLAAQRTSLVIMKLLIEAGSEMERSDREGKTALVHACIHGDGDIIKYLVDLGASVNTCDIFGNSPLMFVTSATIINLEVVETLVSHGALVDCANKSGETALHASITGRRIKKDNVLRVLINSGCNLNLRTGLGHTALHLAVLEHEDLLVEILVRAGCDLETRDELGLTPLFHLARDGNSNMISLFLAAGVNVANEGWLSDEKLISEVRNTALKELLYPSITECPRLSLLCRTSLRKHYGRYADVVFKQMFLPSSLRDYLALNIR